MTRNIGPLLMIICPGVLSVPVQAQTDISTARIETWETTTSGVFLSLTQILPDQSRAFYVNRGFPLEATEQYATSCVFMAVLRNDSAAGVVRFRLDDWSIAVDGAQRPLVSVDEWLNRLEAHGLDKASLVAFRWAQFPPEQEYEPGGDWNQGMLSVGLSPGSRFDLVARWSVGNTMFKGVLRDVECPD
jgi:hypothetical protein